MAEEQSNMFVLNEMEKADLFKKINNHLEKLKVHTEIDDSIINTACLMHLPSSEELSLMDLPLQDLPMRLQLQLLRELNEQLAIWSETLPQIKNNLPLQEQEALYARLAQTKLQNPLIALVVCRNWMILERSQLFPPYRTEEIVDEIKDLLPAPLRMICLAVFLRHRLLMQLVLVDESDDRAYGPFLDELRQHTITLLQQLFSSLGQANNKLIKFANFISDKSRFVNVITFYLSVNSTYLINAFIKKNPTDPKPILSFLHSFLTYAACEGSYHRALLDKISTIPLETLQFLFTNSDGIVLCLVSPTWLIRQIENYEQIGELEDKTSSFQLFNYLPEMSLSELLELDQRIYDKILPLGVSLNKWSFKQLQQIPDEIFESAHLGKEGLQQKINEFFKSKTEDNTNTPLTTMWQPTKNTSDTEPPAKKACFSPTNTRE